RRLDDAFRTYLAERAAKPAPLADVTTLVNGVVALRLAGDAVVELWRRDRALVGSGDGAAGPPPVPAARGVRGRDEGPAAALDGGRAVPAPRDVDAQRLGRLVAAVTGADGPGSETGTRLVWTGDHLEAARRLEEMLAAPARAVTERPASLSRP